MATNETIRDGANTQSPPEDDQQSVEKLIRRHNPDPVPEEETHPSRPEAQDSELQHQGSVE